MTSKELITQLYVGYFDRAPDPAGLAFWINVLDSGALTLTEIAQDFAGQPEAKATYSFLNNDPAVNVVADVEGFIEAIYENLFDRAPEPAGLTFWTNVLQNGFPVGTFIQAIIEGAATADAEVLAHKGTHVIGLFEGRALLAMATLHLLPNMTFGGRAYALVENVVTRGERQGQGLGRQVMERVIDMAWAEGAYKIMLLTGRDLGARGFYEKLGFTGDEKHAMTLRRAPPRAPLPRGAPAH